MDIAHRMPTCIFWVYSAPDVLNARLDARVDAMVKVLARTIAKFEQCILSHRFDFKELIGIFFGLHPRAAYLRRFKG